MERGLLGRSPHFQLHLVFLVAVMRSTTIYICSSICYFAGAYSGVSVCVVLVAHLSSGVTAGHEPRL
ncbi:unnamed protein product, partial [Cylicocyclus nassatus]